MSLSSLSARAEWLLVRTPYRFAKKWAARIGKAHEIADRQAAFARIDLDEAQRRAVSALRTKGYADARDIVDPAVLATAYDTAISKIKSERLTEGPRLNPGKDFWERLLDEDRDSEGRQPVTSPFVQIAIDERVLGVAAAYLEDAPLLDYIYLLHSTHRPGPLKVSQLWHRDYDDTKVLKLFAYFTDCTTDEDGPFTFIPADISATIPFGFHSHRNDHELGLADLATHAKAMKAPRLAAFFVDTSRCYHMGSRVAPDHERLLYMGTYTTFPKYNGRPTNRFTIDTAVSDRQRVALTYG
jgi:hypothetical protein